MRQHPTFIAGEMGVVRYDPSNKVQTPNIPAKPLTVHQRATLYFKAVRCTRSLLSEIGFSSICEPDYRTFVMELGSFVLEMKAEQPPTVAHVTSYPGYVYDPEKITAKVTHTSVGEPGEYVIRVTAMINGLTHRPTYVVIPKNSQDPLKDAFKGALAAAADFIKKDPKTSEKIREFMSKRDLDQEFDRIKSQTPDPVLADKPSQALE